MRFKILGHNDMFTYGSENLTLIEFDEIGKTLAIEAPYHINKHIENIDAVLFTHIDTDHVGGLETFLFRKYFDPNLTRPALIAKDSAMYEFTKTVELTMLRERSCHSSQTHGVIALDTYADCYETCWWKDTKVKEIPGLTIRQPRKQNEHGAMTTSAFLVEFNGETILGYSGDTVFDTMLIEELFGMEGLTYPVIHEAGTVYPDHVCHTSILELVGLPKWMRDRLYINHIPKMFEEWINMWINNCDMHHVKELEYYEHQ